MQYSGIFSDGWVGREGRVVLPAGGAGHLMLRALVLDYPDQRLELSLDGEILFERGVDHGALELRLPVPASRTQRTVELRWAGTTTVDTQDSREAAALIQLLHVTTLLVPTALRLDNLGNPAFEHSGITRDGWIERDAHVVLAAGPSCDLVLRGALAHTRSHELEVTVNGEVRFSGDVGEQLDLRLPVPASADHRRISLRWSETTAVSSTDDRQVAAFLAVIGLATGEPPAVIRRFPADLIDPNLRFSGVFDDGWVGRHAELLLAGGPAGDLVIRGDPIELPDQSIAVSVDDETVASRPVSGTLDLRVPIPAAAAPRSIRLEWEKSAAISASDARDAAAHLTFIGVSTGRPPTTLRRFPADLNDVELDYAGIFSDGWVEERAHAVLAGGAEAHLVIRGTLLEIPGQTLEVVVNGVSYGAQPLAGTRLDLTVPLAASAAPRRVELCWGRTREVSAEDPRQAAAHLATLAIVRRAS